MQIKTSKQVCVYLKNNQIIGIIKKELRNLLFKSLSPNEIDFFVNTTCPDTRRREKIYIFIFTFVLVPQKVLS